MGGPLTFAHETMSFMARKPSARSSKGSTCSENRDSRTAKKVFSVNKNCLALPVSLSLSFGCFFTHTMPHIHAHGVKFSPTLTQLTYYYMWRTYTFVLLAAAN